jgi:predicted aconitase
LFGHAAGLKIPPHEIPVFVKFPRPDIHGLKSAMASMATTSGVELSHFLGLSPEAPALEAVLRPGASKEITVISADDLEDSRACLSCGRRVPVDYVSVGCPHLTIHQLGEVADFLGGKKISANTVTHVWTAAPFKETADRCGITKSIESSGAKLLTNTCPLVSGIMPQGARSLAFDSGKQAHYMKSETDCLISYGSTKDCLKTALSGVWEGATG